MVAALPPPNVPRDLRISSRCKRKLAHGLQGEIATRVPGLGEPKACRGCGRVQGRNACPVLAQLLLGQEQRDELTLCQWQKRKLVCRLGIEVSVAAVVESDRRPNWSRMNSTSRPTARRETSSSRLSETVFGNLSVRMAWSIRFIRRIGGRVAQRIASPNSFHPWARVHRFGVDLELGDSATANRSIKRA